MDYNILRKGVSGHPDRGKVTEVRVMSRKSLRTSIEVPLEHNVVSRRIPSFFGGSRK